MLREQGINSKIVQKLLGHRDVSIALGAYSRVVSEVFSGVTAIMHTASRNLLAGTYALKRNAD